MRVTYIVAGLYFAGQLALVNPVLSAAPGNTNAKPSATNSKTSASTNTEQKLTQWSTRMLEQIDIARQAIAKKDSQTALQHINQALADRSKLASLAKANELPTVVPLYSEFAENSVLRSLEAKRSGRQTSSSPSSNSVAVEKTSGQYTFIGIDLDKAKQRLDAAKTALNNKNPQSAADSLSAVGNELVMETVQSDLPLLTARVNLALAENAVKKEHYSEAATALKGASATIDKYSQQSYAKHVQDAKKLSKTINSYSQSIARDHVGAADKINGWWHQVNNWFVKST